VSRWRRGALLALIWIASCAPAACTSDEAPLQRAADVVLPESDEQWETFPAGTTADGLAAAVLRGISTPQKGPDFTRFVVIRAADRHGSGYRADGFHVVVGAGVALPAGSLRIQKRWTMSGMVDGGNEQLQTSGISLVIEPDAPRPFSAEVRAAVAAFCEALSRRVPIHPDCIVAMQEAPYTRSHAADPDERELAAVARAAVPVPPIDGYLTIRAGDRAIRVAIERRTKNGIQVGMMLRRKFDGTDRGMLFEYSHHATRNFWMKNCRIPIDLAYLKAGKIREIITMEPQWEAPHANLRYYQSNSAVRYALEMPAGWFAKNGVSVGSSVEFE